MRAIAVIIAAAVLLAACDGTLPARPTALPAEQSATGPATRQPPRAAPTADGPQATSPVPSPDGKVGPDAAWQYLADFPAGTAIEVAGATRHADGYVAVGFEPFSGEGFGGRRNGVVWTSGDGLSWSRSTPDALAGASLRSVVSLEGRLYAFGKYSICPELSEDEACADAPDAGTALWRTTDGTEWQRMTVPEGLRVGILDGALTDGQRLIAFGSTGEELVGAVWMSRDGQSWAEIRELAGVDPVSALEAGGGRLVAFGSRYLFEEDEVETLAAWSEGGAFAQAVLPEGQRGVIQDIAWSESGFVAVGVQHDPAGNGVGAIALYSSSGVGWEAAAARTLPEQAAFQHVHAVPAGFLAIGAAPAPGGAGEEARSWFASDGLAWREHLTFGGGAFRQLSSSAVGVDGLVVFATDFAATDDFEPAEPEAGTVHAWFLAREGLP